VFLREHACCYSVLSGWTLGLRSIATSSEQFPTKVCKGETAAGKGDEEGTVKHTSQTQNGGETKPGVIKFFKTTCLMQRLSTCVPGLFARRPANC
jgi:hypothetical protein